MTRVPQKGSLRALKNGFKVIFLSFCKQVGVARKVREQQKTLVECEKGFQVPSKWICPPFFKIFSTAAI
jgi:hypothetical protein